MWSRGLERWYSRCGRHELPWRLTGDPWELLLSEVMLQQTPVGRVIPKWEDFRRRWPSPEAFARAPLGEVLRAWQGLGYPRRAVALHRSAARIAASGWPQDEPGLRALPGIGVYTARALLVLALDQPAPLPRDVNITRVVARAALGLDAEAAPSRELDRALERGRPAAMSRRAYVHALFDAGALHCRARPRCAACPLAAGCDWRKTAGAVAQAPSRRAQRYEGSMRELRGKLLGALLDGVSEADLPQLRDRVAGCRAATPPGAIAEALAGLRSDGLIPDEPGGRPRPRRRT